MRARLQSNPLLVQFNALSLQSNSLWQFLFRRKHFHWKDTTGDEYQREIRYTCTQICHNGKNSIQVRVQYNVIWGREHPNKKARCFIMYQLFGEIRFTFAGLSRDVRSASPSFWNVTHSLDGKFRGQARWPQRDVVAVVALVVVIVIVVVPNWTSFPLRLEVAVSRVTKQMTFRPVETLFPSQLFTHVR